VSVKATLRVRTVEYGDGSTEKVPKFRLEIDGWFDIMRFVPQMLRMQTDFAAAGEKVLSGVKRRWGAEKFAQNLRHLWGSEGDRWARQTPSRKRREL